MATFESKVLDIFDEHPELAWHIPQVTRQLFNESDAVFRKRMRKASEEEMQGTMLELFDILFIDFYFDEIDDYFLRWVIEHYPDRFTDIELEEMHAQADSHLDFYEVQEVIPGQGSYIKSLYSGSEGFLKDVSSSARLAKWDITLSRCYFFRDNYFATGSLRLFGPADKEFIIEQLKKAFAEYKKDSQHDEYSVFAKDCWEIFLKIRNDITTKAKIKKFYTTYGEFQPCEVRFKVQNFKAVLNKMKMLDEFNFVEIKTRRDKKKKRPIQRYEFDWLTLGIEDALDSIRTGEVENGVILTTQQLDRDGNQLGIEDIGTFYLDKELCRLETKSVELAEFAVDHFFELFQDALIFKRITKQKINLKSKNKADNKSAEDLASTQQPEWMNQIEENYFLSMLDERNPALNNLTPHEARHDPALLPKLIDWLKGLENMLEHKRLSGESDISMDKIKQALDLEW